MGIYINDAHRQRIFKNKTNIKEPNQHVYQTNYANEMIQEQKRLNGSLHDSLQDLQKRYVKLESKQTSNWQDIGQQLHELQQMNQQQEIIEQRVVAQLSELANTNRELIDARMEDQSQFKYSHEQIENQLAGLRMENEQFLGQLEKQMALQKQMNQRMDVQQNSQVEVFDRLEKQEALTEKLGRQMENFRQVLFERTNYLAEKIEEGYHLTTSYVDRALTGNDRLPLSSMLLYRNNEKEKESK